MTSPFDGHPMLGAHIVKDTSSDDGGRPLTPAEIAYYERRDEGRRKVKAKVDSWADKMRERLIAIEDLNDRIEHVGKVLDKLRNKQTAPTAVEAEKMSWLRTWDRLFNEELARLLTHMKPNGETWADVVASAGDEWTDRTYWTANYCYKAVEYEYDGDDWTDLVCVPLRPPQKKRA